MFGHSSFSEFQFSGDDKNQNKKLADKQPTKPDEPQIISAPQVVEAL